MGCPNYPYYCPAAYKVWGHSTTSSSDNSLELLTRLRRTLYLQLLVYFKGCSSGTMKWKIVKCNKLFLSDFFTQFKKLTSFQIPKNKYLPAFKGEIYFWLYACRLPKIVCFSCFVFMQILNNVLRLSDIPFLLIVEFLDVFGILRRNFEILKYWKVILNIISWSNVSTIE